LVNHWSYINLLIELLLIISCDLTFTISSHGNLNLFLNMAVATIYVFIIILRVAPGTINMSALQAYNNE